MTYKVYTCYMSNIFFVLGAFLIGFRSCLGLSYIENNVFLRLMTGVMWSLIFFSFALTPFSLSQALKICVLLMLGYFVKKNSSSAGFFFNYFVIISAKNKDIRNAIRSNFWGVFFGFMLVVLLSLLGIIKNRIEVDSMALGFRNPNTTSLMVILLFLHFIYLHYYSIDLLSFFVMTVLAVFWGIITGSRTGLMINLFIIVITFSLRASGKIRNLFKRYGLILSVLICVVTIFCILSCNFISIITKINAIISGRFAQAQFYLFLYGVKPFGSVLKELDNLYRDEVFAQNGNVLPLLDCGYGRLLVNYGFSSFIIFLWLYWKRIKLCTKQNDIRLMLILFCVLLAMVTENAWTVVNFNFTLVYLATVLFTRRNKGNRNEIALS